MDPVTKILFLVECAGAGSCLNASEVKCLIFLVQRQNRSTGQCNPSVDCLMKDTGLGRRTICAALSGLQRKGVISRMGLRFSRTKQNQFKKIDNLAVLRKLNHNLSNDLCHREISPEHSANATAWVHNFAHKQASHCTADMQDFAHKKNNKKDNQKTKKSGTWNQQICDVTDRENRGAYQSAGDFEAKMAEAFEAQRLGGYEALIEVPAKEIETAYVEHSSGRISFEEAFARLADIVAKT